MKAPWPDEVRIRALEIYVTHGAAAAARETGVPRVTVSQWARRNGVTSEAIEQRSARHQMAALTREQRLDELAEDLLVIAQDRAKRLRSGIQSESEREIATVMAIAVDKAQLITGKATSRVETIEPEQAQTKLAEMQEAWRRRQSA